MDADTACKVARLSRLRVQALSPVRVNAASCSLAERRPCYENCTPSHLVGTRSTASPSFRAEVWDAGETRPYPIQRKIRDSWIGQSLSNEVRAIEWLDSLSIARKSAAHKYSNRGKRFSFSPGEKAGMRASVKQTGRQGISNRQKSPGLMEAIVAKIKLAAA